MSAQLVIALTARGGDKIEVWLKPAPLDCQVWRMPFPGPESVTGEPGLPGLSEMFGRLAAIALLARATCPVRASFLA